jgi:hypothetical protein
MTLLKQVIKAKQEANKQFAKYRKVAKAITATVDTTDSCVCATRPGYYWVKEYGLDGGYIQAFNTGVQDRVGMPVLVGIEPQDPYRRVIISLDWGMIPFLFEDGDDLPGSFDLPPHADSHEWSDADPGTDIVSTYQRAIVPLRAQYLSSLTLSVAAGIYFHNGEVQRYSGQDIALTSYVPSISGNHKRVLLYLNPGTNSVQVQDQDEIDDGVEAVYDNTPSGTLPIAWAYLRYGDTTLTDSDITDARSFLNSSLSIDDVISSQDLGILQLTIDHHLDIEVSRHMVEG